MNITNYAIYNWFAVLVLLGIGAQTQAQDSLRMKTGALYSVKVIEISDLQIKYRTYSNPDGPIYSVSKSNVDMYKLEGKGWDYFYDVPESKGSSAINRTPDKNDRSHYIAINLSDLLRTDLTIYYEWIFENKIGLRVPVTYGFRSAHFNLNNPFSFRRNTVFKTGVDLRVYAGDGLRRVRFVFGPAVYYLRLNRVIPEYTTTDPKNMAFKQGNSMRIQFLLGLVIRPNDFIQLGIDGGMGGDIDFKEPAASTYLTGTAVVPKAQLNVHLGYRF
jgi:hypothetical protein